MNGQTDIPTSQIRFIETEHGRIRREQRGIDKKDLQKALKYGTRSATYPRPNGDQTGKYHYNHITYIVNEVTGEEVTSFADPIRLEKVELSEAQVKARIDAKQKIITSCDLISSNTVIVVDRSGSMRAGDVWGCRTRLGAVWFSIALDFVAHRLENLSACPMDVISIVTLESEPKVVIEEEPTTWELYNKLVDIYNSDVLAPYGHGPYLPCLEVVDRLLARNVSQRCALALCFMSDGVPSDKGNTPDGIQEAICEEIRRIIQQHGRRISFKAIGVGASKTCSSLGTQRTFSVLRKMVKMAKDYGSIASFEQGNLTSKSLGQVFTTLSTSLRTTQLETTMIVDSTSTAPPVKYIHESRTAANKKIWEVNQKEFEIYPDSQVFRFEYVEIQTTSSQGAYTCVPLKNKAARFVALCKATFGQGGERSAIRFYEIGSDKRTIIGVPMVAKPSNCILQKGMLVERSSFKPPWDIHKYCTTQQFARRLAREFDQKLRTRHRIDRATPSVEVLDCSVYVIVTRDNRMHHCLLVEDKIDHLKWKKWNCNNGFVQGMEGSFSPSDIMEKATCTIRNNIDFDAIDEVDEEEEVDEERSTDDKGQPRRKMFTDFEVAQAFSHFSYYASGKKRLVCDLQGVLDKDKNLLVLSDPVIHYRSCDCNRGYHGKTDRGRVGMALFFETHKEFCGRLCWLMIISFKQELSREQPRISRWAGNAVCPKVGSSKRELGMRAEFEMPQV